MHPLASPQEGLRQCLGFCLVLNGVKLTYPAGLFALFDGVVAHLAQRGELIGPGRAGRLRAKVFSLMACPREVAEAVKVIQEGLAALEANAKPLPLQNYGSSTTGRQGLYRLMGSIEQDATKVATPA